MHALLTLLSIVRENSSTRRKNTYSTLIQVVKVGVNLCYFVQFVINLSKSRQSIVERATGAVTGSIITANGSIIVLEKSTTVHLGV